MNLKYFKTQVCIDYLPTNAIKESPVSHVNGVLY